MYHTLKICIPTLASISFLIIEVNAQLSIYTNQNRKDAVNWFFGKNEGLSFADGNPMPLLNGRADQREGMAVISNPNDGRLLFYTDGVTVWNAKHSVMSNGNGLKGDFYSPQSALIVPNYIDTNIFYLFTTDANDRKVDTEDGLRYSIIDMQGDGGNGEVVQKNIPLFRYSADQICATRHCNGLDYWIVGYNWRLNSFVSYLITPNGIADTILSEDIGGSIDKYVRGIMQISPNGKLLAKSSASFGMIGIIELFDFDNTSGKVNNKRELASYAFYYGLEFSPDNTKLYALTLPLPEIPAVLYQFNLKAADLDLVRSSRYILYEYNSFYETANGELRDEWDGGQLQLGPDGKIYVSYFGRKYLGVIANPNNLASSCGYLHNGLELKNKGTNLGLPNFIDSDLPGVETTNFSFCFNDYTYYLPTGTVDTDEKVDIFLRDVCLDSIFMIQFEGQDSVCFNHGMIDAVNRFDQPESNCWLPIIMRRVRTGFISVMMSLYTFSGDRHYVRLATHIFSE